jgi:hypothetical protein
VSMRALPSSSAASTSSGGETEQHRHALWHRPRVRPTRWAAAAGVSHRVFSKRDGCLDIALTLQRSASTYNSPHACETCRTLIARLRR